MSKLFKFYYDLMSQPARSLWITLKLSKAQYEDCPVALRKSEQCSEEYKKINRFQKVPCIVDGDFHLAESVAILRYLADSKGCISEQLYPKDVKQRARVDEFLEWHHLTLRLGCAMYFQKMWLLPINRVTPMPSPDMQAKLLRDMEDNLSLFANIFLKNSSFIAGDKLTVADIFGAGEVEQTKLTKYDVGIKFPEITDWLMRVREKTNPYYDEGHKYIYFKSAKNVKSKI